MPQTPVNYAGVQQRPQPTYPRQQQPQQPQQQQYRQQQQQQGGLLGEIKAHQSCINLVPVTRVCN